VRRTIDQLTDRRARSQELANEYARKHNEIVTGPDSPGRWRRKGASENRRMAGVLRALSREKARPEGFEPPNATAKTRFVT
jgi:hypothetical protein